MSVVLGPGDYSFFNVNAVMDFLQSIGMRPIVELSFMPELLASNASETIFHYKVRRVCDIVRHILAEGLGRHGPVHASLAAVAGVLLTHAHTPRACACARRTRAVRVPWRASPVAVFVPWVRVQGGTSLPADFNAWSQLITALVNNFINRYGLGEVRQWKFEVRQWVWCGCDWRHYLPTTISHPPTAHTPRSCSTRGVCGAHASFLYPGT